MNATACYYWRAWPCKPPGLACDRSTTIVLESASFEKQRIQAPRVKQMALSNADKKRFKTIGHSLKPVVIVAQKGFTENIKSEIERALKQHELIKIKLMAGKEERQSQIDAILSHHQAELVQDIGHIIAIYRENSDIRKNNFSKKSGFLTKKCFYRIRNNSEK